MQVVDLVVVAEVELVDLENLIQLQFQVVIQQVLWQLPLAYLFLYKVIQLLSVLVAPQVV